MSPGRFLGFALCFSFQPQPVPGHLPLNNYLPAVLKDLIGLRGVRDKMNPGKTKTVLQLQKQLVRYKRRLLVSTIYCLMLRLYC